MPIRIVKNTTVRNTRARQNKIDKSFCKAIHDGYLCWPKTAAGKTVIQSCPLDSLSVVSKMASRSCGADGIWLDENNKRDPIGYTNYSQCFPEQEIINIAIQTRKLEIAGFFASLMTLLLVLFMMSRYRWLLDSHVQKLRQLFIATAFQIVIKLFLYMWQFLRRKTDNNEDIFWHNYEKGGLLCKISHIAYEYCVSAGFLWIFSAALYLKSVVTVNHTGHSFSPTFYNFIGWGLPLLPTSMWFMITVANGTGRTNFCWFAYDFELAFQLAMHGSRLFLFGINIFILIKVHILSSLRFRSAAELNLSETQKMEIRKARKAARTTIAFLLLLGITNGLNMTQEPLESNIFVFGIWSYTTNIFNGFKGFFLVFLYCFFDGEICEAVYNDYNDRDTMRANIRRRTEQARRDVEDNRDRQLMHDRLRPFFDVSPREALSVPWADYYSNRPCNSRMVIPRPPPCFTPESPDNYYDNNDSYFDMDNLSDDVFKCTNNAGESAEIMTSEL